MRMARKTQTSTLVAPTYVEFEPFCEWKKDEEAETLIIHLPEFKKDQLKVQVNNLGVLKVSGERPMDEAHKSRFLKETTIPKGCNINDIQAKFMNGRLHVIMRKAVPAAPRAHEQEQQPSTSEATQKPKAEALVPNDKKLEASSTGNGKMETNTMTSDNKPKDDNFFGLGSSLAKLGVDKKVAVGFGIAIVAMVAIGAYVAYSSGSDTNTSPSIDESSSK